MLSLILIVLIIVSFTNPKVMVKKEILEKATPEEATKLVKTNRRLFIIVVLLLEAAGMMSNKYFYVGLIFMAVAIGLAVGFKVFSTSKGNKNLVAEIQARESRPEEIEFAENQTYEIPSNDTQVDENNMQ